MNAVIRKAAIEDAEPMLAVLRGPQLEVLGDNPETALATLRHFLAVSEDAVIGEVDGDPVVMAGVVQYGTQVASVGLLWMSPAPGVWRHKKRFLRETRRIISRWKEDFPVLRDYVPVNDNKTIRWLQWLGFQKVGMANTHIGECVTMECRP